MQVDTYYDKSKPSRRRLKLGIQYEVEDIQPGHGQIEASESYPREAPVCVPFAENMVLEGQLDDARDLLP